jgi:hypothetical protein
MAKEFYTEKDIEDLFKRGIQSLVVGENVVLTELAYEKAGRLGMKLIQDKPDNPPSAPVRPYLSQNLEPKPSAGQLPPRPAASNITSPVMSAGDVDLSQRIKSAVIARLGSQVDEKLLDVIIQRVLKSTGVK